MASQLQLRRGTTVQHGPFIGAPAEVTVDTDKKTLVVHDGTTPGGFPVLSASGGTMTGPVSMGGSKITNLATPTASADAAPKGYVDGLVAAATLADADYGDITVSGGATVWTIDSGAVTSDKIANETIVNADIANDTITNAKIKSDAAIALSKLATGALPTGITIASANIVNGTITVSDLAAAVTEMLLPPGAIMPFATSVGPAGWLSADGGAVSRTTYAALFAAIGTTYGSGDGSTTFNLPDLRGVFVRGSGSQTISGTTYSGTFGAKQGQNLRDHKHVAPIAISGSRFRANEDPFGAESVATMGFEATATSTSIGDTYSLTSGIATSGQSGETYPANISLFYCIKY